MRANSVGFAVAAPAAPSPSARSAKRSPAASHARDGSTGEARRHLNGRFELTVDSIMRGPDLVGYPPTGLRWSADSQKLYFDWRKPAEEKASTYVVGRAGGEPRKLSEDEAKNIPPAAGGRWDKARRRVLFVDGGDIVLVDAIAGIASPDHEDDRRRVATRAGRATTPTSPGRARATSSSRRSTAAASSLLTQLTDVAPRRPEPRLTDSQRFIRDEEEKLIDFVEKQKAEKKKTEDEQKKNRLPQFELQERQTAADLMLSPDDTHVFIVDRRARGRREDHDRAELRHRDRLHRRHSGAVQRRRHAGPPAARRAEPQDRQDASWADGSFAPALPDTAAEKPADGASDCPRRRAGPPAAAGTRHPLVDAGRVRRRQVR